MAVLVRREALERVRQAKLTVTHVQFSLITLVRGHTGGDEDLRCKLGALTDLLLNPFSWHCQGEL